MALGVEKYQVNMASHHSNSLLFLKFKVIILQGLPWVLPDSTCLSGTGNKIWYMVDVGGSKMVFRYKGKIKGNKIKMSLKTIMEN